MNASLWRCRPVDYSRDSRPDSTARDVCSATRHSPETGIRWRDTHEPGWRRALSGEALLAGAVEALVRPMPDSLTDPMAPHEVMT
jgi:hypothetical protein